MEAPEVHMGNLLNFGMTRCIYEWANG